MRDVLAQGGALSQDLLHLVEERNRFTKFALLPAHEGESLDGLDLVVIRTLPAHRHNLFQVVA